MDESGPWVDPAVARHRADLHLASKKIESSSKDKLIAEFTNRLQEDRSSSSNKNIKKELLPGVIPLLC